MHNTKRQDEAQPIYLNNNRKLSPRLKSVNYNNSSNNNNNNNNNSNNNNNKLILTIGKSNTSNLIDFSFKEDSKEAGFKQDQSTSNSDLVGSTSLSCASSSAYSSSGNSSCSSTNLSIIGHNPTSMATQCSDNGQNNENHSSNTLIESISIRMLMSGKEVGCIIGKKGSNVKRYREESGARINISDCSSAERIVTVTGQTSQIQKAFELICRKFEDDYLQIVPKDDSESDPINLTPTLLYHNSSPPVTLRLLIPGPQCGLIIGKGGTKIKEIREMTGTSVQVASEVLPHSTERIVTISGCTKAIFSCIRIICELLQENINRCPTIPYKPRPTTMINGIIASPVTNLFYPQALSNGNTQFFSAFPGNSFDASFSPFPQPNPVTGGALFMTSNPPSSSPFIGSSYQQSNSQQSQAQSSVPSSLSLSPQQSLLIQQQQLNFTNGHSSAGASFAVPNAANDISNTSLNGSSNLLSSSHTASMTDIAAAASLISNPNSLASIACNPYVPMGFHNPATTASLLSLSGFNLSATNPFTLGLFASASPHLAGTGLVQHAQHSQEMVIPNELIGCVIGRGGNKINEIRQSSGAQIKISNVECGAKDRKITISGTADQVQIARILIQQSIEAHRQILVANLLSSVVANGGNFPLSEFHKNIISPGSVFMLNNSVRETASLGQVDNNANLLSTANLNEQILSLLNSQKLPISHDSSFSASLPTPIENEAQSIMLNFTPTSYDNVNFFPKMKPKIMSIPSKFMPY